LSDNATLRSTFARGGDAAVTAERSELLQPGRPQPISDTNEQLHSRRPFIPADLVQNTAEYLGCVPSLLSFRGVSTGWQGAVSDAVGFLNGRCWTELRYDRPVWTALVLDCWYPVFRFTLLCLAPRLETLVLTNW
jgi:hypothetical protein